LGIDFHECPRGQIPGSNTTTKSKNKIGKKKPGGKTEQIIEEGN